MKEHKPGFPVQCQCGELLHTPKAVKWHRCAKAVRVNGTAPTKHDAQ